MVLSKTFHRTAIAIAVTVLSSGAYAADRMVVYANGVSLIEKTIDSLYLDRNKFVIKNSDGNVLHNTIYVDNAIMRNVSVKSSYQTPFNFEALLDQNVTISSVGAGILAQGILKEYSGNYLVLQHGSDYISQQMGDYSAIRFNEGVMYISSDADISIPKHDQGIVLTVDGAKDEFTVGYMTQGFNWNGAYELIMNSDNRAQLLGYAQISNNTNQDITDVNLELVAGKVSAPNRAQPRQMAMAKGMIADSLMESMPVEDKAGDWHRFTVNNVDALPARSSTRELLFNVEGIDVAKEFTFHANRPLFTPSLHTIDQHAGIYVELINEIDYGIGRALPAGEVNIYQYDNNRKRIYSGQDRISNLSEGDRARLFMGEAFDLKVEARVTREEYEKDHRGRITQLDRLEEFKVINNQDKDAVTSIYVKAIDGTDVLEVVESTHSYRRKGDEFVFDVPVKAGATDYLILKTVAKR